MLAQIACVEAERPNREALTKLLLLLLLLWPLVRSSVAFSCTGIPTNRGGTRELEMRGTVVGISGMKQDAGSHRADGIQRELCLTREASQDNPCAVPRVYFATIEKAGRQQFIFNTSLLA